MLKGLIHLLVEEHRTDRPGAAFTSTQLAQLMFPQILRGVAPLTYLTEWRMRLAERELSRSDASFAELASSLGYASESAFSTAFKQVTGVSPKSYRLNARRRGPPGGEAMLLV